MEADGIDLVELDRGECLELLGHGEIGRVAFTERALPMIQPVRATSSTTRRSCSARRTAASSRRRGGARGGRVSGRRARPHHQDRLDGHRRGEAHEVVDPRRLAELAALQPRPWVRGHDAHTIAVPLLLITGRRLVAGTPAWSPGQESESR